MPHASPARERVRLVDNLRVILKRAWSIRVAMAGVVFWGVVSALWAMWPAFVDWLPLWAYAVGGALMSVALAVARVLKQPGLE